MTTRHFMLPGSHERPGGAECRCGAGWDRWADRCASGATNPPAPVTLFRLVDAAGDVVSEPHKDIDYYATRLEAQDAIAALCVDYGPLTIEQTTFIPRWNRA